MIFRPADVADAQAIATIHVASCKQGYHGIVPPPALAGEDVAQKTTDWEGWLHDTHTILAEDDGVAMGFCAVGPVRTRLASDRGPIPRFAGEVYALYVHPDHWRKGVGRGLLRAGFASLKQAGLPSALLWVLAKNDPAIALYLSEGGEKCGKRMIEMNGFPVKETAIGFRRI